MTSTSTPVLDPAPLHTPVPVPVSRPQHPAASCAVVTIAVLAVAVTDPAQPTWTATALALAAVTVGWGGATAHRAAWTALRRGRVTADTPIAAGLLALLGAAVAAAAGHPGDLGPAVVAAVVATLHATGSAVAARVEPPVDGAPPVERARRGAAALDRATQRAAGGFAAIAVVAAVAALAFRLGAGSDADGALAVAAAVLLAGCPQVVGRAIGTALITGTARAARLGALLDGPRTAEALARVDTVVLCRTGTLAAGVRSLTAVHVAEGVDADGALRIAGAVAAAGREAGGVAGLHPVGAVVADAARDRFGELPGVAEFDGYPGLGVRGIVTELRIDANAEPRVLAHAALVGRVDLLTAHGIALPDELAATVTAIHATGATAIAVSWDGVARAVLEVADPIRPGAPEAVAALRELGLTTVLLSGADAGAARGLAAVLGVEEVTGDRHAAVERLRAAGRTVAVVGGPADRTALAQADVALVRRDPRSTRRAGIVTLDDDDPLTCADAVRAARATMRTVERTLTGAAAYHLVALPAAVAGLLPPLAAVVAATAFHVAALLHATALRRVRPLPRPDAPGPGVTCR
jgi:Cu+-exporting ATPase